MNLLFTVLLLLPAPTTLVERCQTQEPPKEVRYAQKHAGPDYALAIDYAYSDVDPLCEHPEWKDELWRICHRESWCGKWGSPKVHKGDMWAGTRAYAEAVIRGELDPLGCRAHRLSDYRAVKRKVRKLTRAQTRGWTKTRRNKLFKILEDAGPGQYTAADFSTRGGFGMMAAYNLSELGECSSPEDLDDPEHAAFVAAWAISTCVRWDTNPNTTRKTRRTCTCAEHTQLWVGIGYWESRTYYERYRSVTRQCGPQPPLTPFQIVSDLWAYAVRWVQGDYA